jgi:predicted NAD/FAD-dependent oxidoreductase
MTSSQVAIVGAGLAGLVAARELVELGRRDVVVLERGATVGGRLATDRIGEAVLDHGAQFFTVRTDPLRADVERWVADGVVEEWCHGFAEVDGFPRYRVAGGMANLAVHLAADLGRNGVEVVCNTAVTAIKGREGSAGWLVLTAADRDAVAAQAVIATPPVPLTLDLLAAGGVALRDDAAALDGFAYHKVLALLTVLDRSPGLPAPGALQQPNDDTFSFVSDNEAKGISPVPAVTFHTAHARSAELWALGDDRVLEALLPAARTIVAPAEIAEVEVVRWLHTGPVSAHPAACVVAADGPTGPVVIAGDGFGGSKVEGAYSSGRAAAAATVSG